MAKYLKTNQIVAGNTIYLADPKALAILELFIVDRPKRTVLGLGSGVVATMLVFKTVKQTELDTNFQVDAWFSNYVDSGEREYLVNYGFSGDMGIPNKLGEFRYKNTRRAFSSYNKALRYIREARTEAQLLAWKEEDKKRTERFGMLWGSLGG